MRKAHRRNSGCLDSSLRKPSWLAYNKILHVNTPFPSIFSHSTTTLWMTKSTKLRLMMVRGTGFTHSLAQWFFQFGFLDEDLFFMATHLHSNKLLSFSQGHTFLGCTWKERDGTEKLSCLQNQSRKSCMTKCQKFISFLLKRWEVRICAIN